jgi:uncharacterized protein YegL
MKEKNTTDYQKLFTCKFPQAKAIFSECLEQAQALLSESGIKSYFTGANFLCSIGQGVEPVMAYMKVMPEVASKLGEGCNASVAKYAYKIARSPNKKALVPLIHSLSTVSQQLESDEDLQQYFEILDSFVEQTQTVIHGHNSLYESSGFFPMMQNMPELISKLDLKGLSKFIDYGASNYKDAPDQQIEYFSLKSHDAQSIIQRERQGTAFKNIERQLNLSKQGLWECDLPFSVFTTDANQARVPVPYLDDVLIAVPDVYEDKAGISGLNRYRAMLAHLMAHKRWTTPLVADNLAPHMQFMIATFEDARVDVLAMHEYPGLKKFFLALHPIPQFGECPSEGVSCIRYRATLLSRALIDIDFDPKDELIEQLTHEFHDLLTDDKISSTAEMMKLGIKYYIKSRVKSDNLPEVYFKDTEVSYRDDNRQMWLHHEAYDEADEVLDNEYQSDDKATDDGGGLPPRYYDEWDYNSQSYRPDWNKVFERLHPSGDATIIDKLMQKHNTLAQRLKNLIEILKPQNKKRIRFQEEGEELDLDIALRSIIDYKSGHTPDVRINYSYTPDNRDIAVMLLVDLSESLNQTNKDTGQTLLELSQEALAITAWTIDKLGDKFSIAGFSSNTRSEVRYQHIKGYSENYNETVKARIAAMQASHSTRMGAAMRHAAHYLESQKAEKKIMLILTDGEPADIDAKDPKALIKDTKKAVEELHAQGIYSYCISLDPDADDYVEDIFSNQYSIIDDVKKLPEKLPQVFMRLTR